jgi:hypothetical protein
MKVIITKEDIRMFNAVLTSEKAKSITFVLESGVLKGIEIRK